MRRVQPGHQRFLLALIVSVLLGSIGLAPVSSVAAQPLPPPTLGDIVVNSFNCETGRLVYHVYVENLVHVADAVDRLDFPLRGNQVSNYDGGASYTPEYLGVFNPSASGSPYTGDITTTTFVPLTDPAAGDGDGAPIVSIFISASVGDGDPGTSDSSSLLYTVDCGDDTLVDQLVAVLIQILDDILNG